MAGFCSSERAMGQDLGVESSMATTGDTTGDLVLVGMKRSPDPRPSTIDTRALSRCV